MRVIVPIPKQFEDSNGVPYANGKVTVYLHNSTSHAQIYKEAEGDALAPNPTILDSHGAWNAFVNGGTAYDYVVQDEHDNVIFSYSNVSVSGLGAAAESIYEIAMFDLSQAGHNLYGDIDSDLVKGLLPIIAAGSQGLVRYYYYTARDSQAHTMTFTCGYNGSVELLVLKDDDTYEFTSIAKSVLIANKYDTHYVSGTDAGTGLSDGDFLFSERAKTGEDIWIGDDHKIYCKKGWYHFDFTTLIFVNPIDYTHNGGTQPRIDTIHLSAGGYGASVDADLDRCATAMYKTSVHISGDFYASSDGYNVGANITDLGYNAYAYVDKMCVHKVSEDE